MTQSLETGTGNVGLSIWPSKWRAVGIHFLLSLAAFLVVAYLILAHWYPGFHFLVDGGWQGVRIMVGVDLVLGPMLTLLVFDIRKTRRAIIFDLSCIGLIQVSAMIWGIQAIYSQRVAAIAFKDNALFVVYADDLNGQEVDLEQFKAKSGTRLPLVFLRPPDIRRGELGVSLEKLNIPREAHAHLYQAWDQGFESVLAKGRFDAERAAQDFPDFGQALDRFLDDAGRSLDDTALITYYGRFGRRMLAFDGQTGAFLGVLPYYDAARARDEPPLF